MNAKMEKGSRQSYQERYQMVNKYIKRWLPSLVTKEMHIETRMKSNQYLAISKAKIKMTESVY